MIYGSSNAQSALGSLLRKMQEETQTNPARIPVASAESSPIREQIQGPLSNPESIGSDKVVAMKPEMAPSAETPSPVAPTNMVSPTPTGIAAAAAGSPTVVGPNNIVTPSSPEISSGITPPTSARSVIPSTPAPGVSLPSANLNSISKAVSPSLANKPLLPSTVKNTSLSQQMAKIPGGTISQGYSTSPTQKAAAGGGAVGASSFLSRLVLGLGTFISKSTLNKAIESMKYGGKKSSQI